MDRSLGQSYAGTKAIETVEVAQEFLERTFAESPFTTEFFAQRGAYLQATDQLLGTNWRNILPEAASFHDEFYPFTKRLPSDRDELNLSST